MKIQLRYRDETNQPFYVDVETGKELSLIQVQDVINNIVRRIPDDDVVVFRDQYYQAWEFKTNFSKK